MADSPSFFGRGSASIAIFTLAKGALGAGILALPQKAMFTGIPLFTFILFLGSYFTARSVEMISRGCEKAGKYGYEDVTEHHLGKPSAIVLGFSMLLNCYGSSVAYVIVIRGALSPVFHWLDELAGSCYPQIITYSIGVVGLVAMSQYQRLESLRFLSVAGVVGTVLATFSVIYALFHDGTADDIKGASVLETFQSTIRPNGGIVDMIGAVSTVTFSLCNQFNVPQVIEGLKTKDAVSVRKVAFGAASIPALLYVVTAVAGYLHSGKRTRENVFGNFAALIEARNIVINLGVVSVVLSIAVCHILNNFPLRSSVLFFLPPKWTTSAWAQHGIPFLSAVSTILIGVFFSKLSMLLGLIGALTGSVICYIMPALLSIHVEMRATTGIKVDVEREPLLSEHDTKRTRSCVSRALEIARHCPLECVMVLFGILLAVVGTVTEFYIFFGEAEIDSVRI